MNSSQKVTLIEVGPRDGLQNESVFVPTSTKIKWVNLLSQTGLKHIEVTSFVSPKAIPQLADNEAVFRGIDKPKGVNFSALVPNEQGMNRALEVGMNHIAIFTAASESFNQHNINCSIADSIEREKPVMALARAHKIHVRAYISCALGCPYEGTISPKNVVAVANQLLVLGVDEISLGDTIGVGTPKQTKALIHEMRACLPLTQVAMHFHDTYGQALVNTLAALQMGVWNFQSSIAGLGGCPYAKGATGNVATEDVVYMMHGMGIDTGIDLDALIDAGAFISQALGRPPNSLVARAVLNKRAG